jgi:hypothetical protein
MEKNSNHMQIRYCALGLGILFLLIGLAGFVPGFVSTPVDASPIQGYGKLFGLFPTNYLHNALGIVFGILGITAFTSLTGSIVFNQVIALVYTAHTLLGLLPLTNTLFGIMPLYGNNVWFSALNAAIGFYFGFVKTRDIRNFGTTARV